MKVIFELLLKFIVVIANLFLAPVNALVANVLPDFSQMVSDFYRLVDLYIGDGIVYFFNLLPPNCKSLIILYLTLLGIFYTTTLAIHTGIKVVEILKNVKVW